MRYALSGRKSIGVAGVSMTVLLSASVSHVALAFASPSTANPSRACSATWLISPTPVEPRKHVAVAVSTANHVVVWGGAREPNNVVLTGATLDRRTGEWTVMAEPPSSSPKTAVATSDGKVLFSQQHPSLYDPSNNRWNEGWTAARISKNTPLLVGTPHKIVSIQRDLLGGDATNEVEFTDRSGNALTQPLPRPPAVIGYESTAVWAAGISRSSEGRIIVLQADGPFLALDLDTQQWTELPDPPVEFVTQTMVASFERSHLTILGLTGPGPRAKSTDRSAAFARFDLRTNKWSLGPKAAGISPNQLARTWGPSSGMASEMTTAHSRDGSSLIAVVTDPRTKVRVAMQYSTSGSLIRRLPTFPSPPASKIIAHDGQIGAVLSTGSWATICLQR